MRLVSRAAALTGAKKENPRAKALLVVTLLVILDITPTVLANHGGELDTSIPYEYYQSVSFLLNGNVTTVSAANSTALENALSLDLSLFLNANVTGYSNSTNVPFLVLGQGALHDMTFNASGYLFCNATSDCMRASAALLDLNATSCDSDSSASCAIELTFAKYQELLAAEAGSGLTLYAGEFGEVQQKEVPIPLVIHAEMTVIGSAPELAAVAANETEANGLLTALLSDMTDAADAQAELLGFEIQGLAVYLNFSLNVSGYHRANETIETLKSLPATVPSPLTAANAQYAKYTGSTTLVLAVISVTAALYYPPPATYYPIYLSITFDGAPAVFEAWLLNSTALQDFQTAAIDDALEAVNLSSTTPLSLDGAEGVSVNGTLQRLRINATINVTSVSFEIANVTALRGLPYFALDGANASITPQWLVQAEQIFLQGALHLSPGLSNGSQLIIYELLAWGPDIPLPTPTPAVTPQPTTVPLTPAPTNASTVSPPTPTPIPTYRFKTDAELRITGNDAVFARLLQDLVSLKAALMTDLAAALRTEAIGITSVTSGSILASFFVNATSALIAGDFKESVSGLGNGTSWLGGVAHLYNVTATAAERASATFPLGVSVLSVSVADRNAAPPPPPAKSNNTALIVIVVIIVIIVIIIAVVCIIRMTMNTKKGRGRSGGGGGGGGGGGRRPKNEQYGQEFSMGPVPPRPGDHPV